MKSRAILDVTDDRVPVARDRLQITFTQPLQWSIVPLPADAVNVPSEWGGRYIVCPACQARAPLSGHPMDLPCPHCGGVFRIAWDEHYLRRKR